mmetsp:Transcript_22777/g.45434  ORF Transcript_22777/g.45434 Transcript_22777/m.45434 type:complete len:224 (+) Transcript_22777:1318-1989(+)
MSTVVVLWGGGGGGGGLPPPPPLARAAAAEVEGGRQRPSSSVRDGGAGGGGEARWRPLKGVDVPPWHAASDARAGPPPCPLPSKGGLQTLPEHLRVLPCHGLRLPRRPYVLRPERRLVLKRRHLLQLEHQHPRRPYAQDVDDRQREAYAPRPGPVRRGPVLAPHERQAVVELYERRHRPAYAGVDGGGKETRRYRHPHERRGVVPQRRESDARARRHGYGDAG